MFCQIGQLVSFYQVIGGCIYFVGLRVVFLYRRKDLFDWIEGGVMIIEDLVSYVIIFEDLISVDYKGYRVWEVFFNGQGIIILMVLNILEGMDLKGGLC